MDNEMKDGWYDPEMVSYRDPVTFALVDKPRESQMVVYPRKKKIEEADSERGRIIQKTEMIPLEAALQVITNWWDKDPTFHWNQTPAWVIIKMIEAVEDEGSDEALLIPYVKAVSILKQAETRHPTGPANNGMRYIQDEWKKLYLP
jgi:hypothetical protein